MTQTPRKPGHLERLDRLDGLRGLAALAVVVYHYTVRWAAPYHSETLYPFGTVFPDLFPFLADAGQFGVRLFFVTSGFVILLTLERSSGLVEFAVRRMARLWPTMLVCATLSTLIINLSGFAWRVPSLARFEVTSLEYVSSIFFVDPTLVASLIGAPSSQWVEGVYWTLWAEVRFYALIALTWYIAGSRWFIWAWLILLLGSVSLASGITPGSGIYTVDLCLRLVLQPTYLAWFSVGILAYRAWTKRSGAVDMAVLLLCLIKIALLDPRADLAANLFVLGAFFLALMPGPWTQVLTWRPLLSIGLASYPLYLFHERAGIIILHDLGNAGVPAILLLPAAFAGAIMAALLIHRIVEAPARQSIRKRLQPLSDRVQNKWPLLRFRSEGA